MTKTSTQALFEQLKSKHWVDLTHPFGPDSPHFPAFQPAEFKTIFTTDQDGFFVKQYTFPGQYGIHLDPPVHFYAGDQRYIDDLPIKDLVLPLVVIDHSELAAQDPDRSLTVEDLQAWEQEHGEIPAGAFVALRTDWSKRWPSQAKFENQDAAGQNHYPGWSIEALKYIYEERHAKANGHETFDTDTAVDQTDGLPAEYYVLSHGHFQVELLTNLDQVPPTGAEILISVPRAEKAPGFPVRAVAIFD
ncbi:cyclase family protein [uncultured Limosilactobacillus sp.]|uniref:cyclase family protein n=1 Tax=uncultured Limosilactobacillus sp. TaxID=2837629 RepID=UPI0025F9E40E|nr:cyclase family protein [uncultured Limosilactobacillus sp.]